MATGSVSKKKRYLDTSNANKGVWLVKVPNYLAEAWKKASKGQELGKMRISKKTNPALVQFMLAPNLMKITIGESEEIVDLPSQHRVNIQEAKSQCISAFTEDQSNGDVVVNGKVVQRADIQPVDSSIYMALKKHQIQVAEKTKFSVGHIDKIPQSSYKPKARHKEHEAIEKKRKELKKAREDKSVVLDLLFSAYKHHQYYTFKDLVDITQQPAAYLKEILKEVCVYNTKAPHKYTWQLKPEYSMSTSSKS